MPDDADDVELSCVAANLALTIHRGDLSVVVFFFPFLPFRVTRLVLKPAAAAPVSPTLVASLWFASWLLLLDTSDRSLPAGDANYVHVALHECK